MAEWQSKDRYAGKWQYWSGAWPRSPHVERYDQMPVPATGSSMSVGTQDVDMETWDASSAGTALMLAVQKTLTLGRKAEGKARKLKEELRSGINGRLT